MAAAGGALLFVAVAAKGRSDLHLSSASCYHFSHLCPHPAPSLPLLLFPPPIPPFLCLFGFDIHQSVWSEVRKGKGGTHARHWTSDPSTRWTFSCRLPVSPDTRCVCFRYNNTGFFAFARTGTQGLKKQQRWTSYKSFVTAEICLLYGSDSIAGRSLSLLGFRNIKMRLQSLPLALRSMLYAEKHHFSPTYSQGINQWRQDRDSYDALAYFKSDGDAGGCYRLSPVWTGKKIDEGSACWRGARAVTLPSRAPALPIGLKRALLVARGSCILGEIIWRKARPQV